MAYPWNEHIDHDACGELDLSNSGGKSGAIGCMVRRLTDLRSQEQQLLQELAYVRAAESVAMAALDRFIADSSK